MFIKISKHSVLFLLLSINCIYIPQYMRIIFSLKTVPSIALFSPIKEKFEIIEFLLPWQRKNLHGIFEETTEHGLIHRDENGTIISREEFENNLPFIYTERLLLRGLLPIKIQKKSFSVDNLRKKKTIMFLRRTDRDKYALQPKIHALIDSRDDRIRLLFPEDRFRLRNGIEFINTDTNTIDDSLSKAFTDALKNAGCTFPIQKAFGRDIILKPWDAGWYLLDARDKLWNMRRFFNRPIITAIPLPPNVKVNYIQVQESQDKNTAALLLSTDHKIYVLSRDSSLQKISCSGYTPDSDDVKIVRTPLGDTCIFDNHTRIAAIHHPHQKKPLPLFERLVPSHDRGLMGDLCWFCTPLEISLTPPQAGPMHIRCSHGGWTSLLGALLWGSLAAFQFRKNTLFDRCCALLWAMVGGPLLILATRFWIPQGTKHSVPTP